MVCFSKHGQRLLEINRSLNEAHSNPEQSPRHLEGRAGISLSSPRQRLAHHLIAPYETEEPFRAFSGTEAKLGKLTSECRTSGECDTTSAMR